MNKVVIYLALIDTCLIFRAITESTNSSMILHSIPSKSIRRSDGTNTERISVDWCRLDYLDRGSYRLIPVSIFHPHSSSIHLEKFPIEDALLHPIWECWVYPFKCNLWSHILCGETTVKRAGMSGLIDGSVVSLRCLQWSIKQLNRASFLTSEGAFLLLDSHNQRRIEEWMVVIWD